MNKKGDFAMRSFCEDSQTAFTLAEVLVTLGIIGVVAAMTLPSVIATHKKHEAEARLKKVYSTLNQAFLAAQAKHGEAKYWPEWDDAEVILEMYFLPELTGAKSYGKKPNAANSMCYDGVLPNISITGGNGGVQYGWNGASNYLITSPFYGHETASIKLLDGSCIGLNSNKARSDQKMVFVDINGANRAPNKAGHDLFFFIIDENSIRPYGWELKVAKQEHECIRDSGGLTCAAKIMSDNWTIKYW